MMSSLVRRRAVNAHGVSSYGNWTKYELNGLVAKEMTGKKLVLPIWHHITADGIMEFSGREKAAPLICVVRLDKMEGESWE